jgi:methionyl-tRNA formyltransferase
MSKPLNIIFMGTPQFVVPVLEGLIGSQHNVIGVFTQPPRPSGRGQQIQKSPVHECADKNNIPVLTPKSLKGEEAQKEFLALKPDVAVVSAYGLLLPKIILDAPKYGCINIHVSLLPRWRGASPIQYAILKGDTETGVTIMKMDVGMDTGDMIAQQSLPITNTTTSKELYDTLFKLGAQMVVPILNDADNIKATVQDESRATHAPMIKKEEGKIDWSHSAIDIDRRIRAFNPWPATYCMTGDKRLKVLEATAEAGIGPKGTVLDREGRIACGQGILRLIKIQPDGGKPMDVAAAVNGGYLKVGDTLS